MPVFTQGNMSITGNVVDIYDNAGPAHVLYVQPGGYVEVPETPLQVRKGTFTLTVGSLDKANRETRIDEPEAAEDVIFYNCLPIRIDVFRIGNDTPVASKTTRTGPVRGTHPGEPPTNYQTRLVVDAGPVDETQRYSRTSWKIRFTNETDKVAEVIWFLRYIRDSSLVTKSQIPLSVVNNAFGIVLNALSPQARLRGGLLTVQLSPEMAEHIGSLPSDGAMEVDLSDQLSPAEANGDLTKVQVRLVSGADALGEVDRIWAERDAVLRTILGSARALNDAWREKWHERIDVTDVAVQFDVAFTDIEILLPRLWIEPIPLGEIADASAKIFLIFKSHTAFSEPRFGKGHALVITPYKIEGVLLTLADIFGKVPDLGAKIEEYANKAIPTIHRYFAEVVIRMVHNQFKKRFIDCRLHDEHLEVVFCDDPADPGAFPVAGEPVPVVGGIRTGSSRVRREVLGPLDLIDAGDTPPPEPVGVVPSEFYLGTAAGLAQLDEVETIIVVMMENRSFDHMLGRLSRKWPDRGYICYPDGVSNSVPDRSPVKMVPARDIQQGSTYYAIRVDPYHGMDPHVLAQINNGQMDGFARDIMTKPNPRERIPQVPLTYYDETDLPFFYNTLAANYLVCDQWFAAHPGGTYPNRWACLSGTMAQVKNFELDDPRMGFIKLPTIFDVLAPYTDVEWIYYETNLGMLRMYDRYRLDSTRVLPFYDKHRGFVARAREGTLPPVVFIEPRITGIPPLEQASDDHPPANLLRGQEFLQDVYRALIAPREFSQWGKCMLVITYDEHGGFFDHVAPPGTPLGPEEWRPVTHPRSATQEAWTEYKVPLIHPEGKRFMGPRVPTFIVSPLVQPGSVCHTVFDHTSILKTILTKHRAKFRASEFGMFGERVLKINHLGEALTPPVSPPVAEDPTRVPRTPQNFGDVVAPPVTLSSLPPDVLAGTDEAPYGFSLARAMMPKR